ncbi:N-acetylmuramoyl-L-alanine amidase [Xanthomonas hortorum]
MITIHTNAASDAGTPQTTASGSRLFYNSSKAGASTLASNLTCAMKEVINSNSTYATWAVTTQQPTTLYGENNFANLPAVVVEVGFKDNVNDAAAMVDPVFQDLMAKGIEKGARLSRESKVCKPFKLISAANISGPNKTRPPVVVKFEGFPQFPIKVHAHVTCPRGSCNDGDFTINSTTDDTFTWNFGCNSSASTATIVYGVETTAVDADGVKVAAVKSNVTCQQVVAGS